VLHGKERNKRQGTDLTGWLAARIDQRDGNS
jgi:hypothetical protein